MSIRYRKHLSYGRKWDDVVRETAIRPKVGKYSSALSHDDIRRIELNCALNGTLISERPGESWMKFDRTIGANDGTETRFIVVRLEENGSYHGFPLTREQLHAMGVPWDQLS